MKTTIIIAFLILTFGGILYVKNKPNGPALTSPTVTVTAVTETPTATSSPESSAMCDFAAPPSGCHYENIRQTPCHADLVCAQSVDIASLKFTPGSTIVRTGTKVTWQNNDSVTHSIIASDGSFHSPNLNQGDKFEFTFIKSGQYDYHCGIHPSMLGKIIVQ